MRWLATPMRTLVPSSCSANMRAQAFAQSGGVDDLAVAQHAGAQVGDRALGDHDLAVDADLGGGDVARVELETDDGLLLAAA